MIVDTHTHFYDPARPQGVAWPPPSREHLYRTVLPRHYKALAEPEGVTATVVVEASPWVEDNQWILDLAAEDPFIVGLVGRLDPGSEEFPLHLERFGENPLFRGIRLGAFSAGSLLDPEGRRDYFAGLAGGNFLADLERLADRDLALDALVGHEHLEGVVEVARRLPALRIVINHVAQARIDGRAPDPSWAESIQKAAEHPQVYCKVSGLMESSQVRPAPAAVEFYAPVLDALWDAFGEDRLIYGSNWPVSEPSGTYAQVQGIVYSYFSAKGGEAAAKYFHKNSKAAYKWIERG